MPEDSRGRLDRAIDRAVREMVQADPRPGLEHRVRDRIHRPSAFRIRRAFALTSTSGWPLPALAAAAFLVVVLGALLILRTPATTSPEGAPVADIEPVPAPVPRPGPRQEPPIVPPGTAPPVAVGAPAPAVASTPRPSGNLFGERSGLVRAADLPSPPGRAAVGEGAFRIDDAPATGEVFGGLAPLAPITIAPIQLAPLAVSPVTVNALPGGK